MIVYSGKSIGVSGATGSVPFGLSVHSPNNYSNLRAGVMYRVNIVVNNFTDNGDFTVYNPYAAETVTFDLSLGASRVQYSYLFRGVDTDNGTSSSQVTVNYGNTNSGTYDVFAVVEDLSGVVEVQNNGSVQ